MMDNDGDKDIAVVIETCSANNTCKLHIYHNDKAHLPDHRNIYTLDSDILRTLHRNGNRIDQPINNQWGMSNLQRSL